MTTSEFRDTAATTLARIEAKQDVMGDKIDNISVVLLGNGKPEEGLLFKVTEHHKKTHLSDLVKHKWFWAAAVGIFISLQLAGIGDPLMRFVAKLLGAPLP
jgi:hypothetical protein